MRRFSAATRISIGITCLTLSLVLAAQGLGIIPNAGDATIRGRKQLCESLAVNCSIAAQKGQIDELMAVAGSVAQRNPEVLSLALRKASGEVLAKVGDHDKQWLGSDKD